MFKRIKNLWNLGKYTTVTHDENGSPIFTIKAKELGDGNAAFISEGTEKEFKDFEDEKKGLKGIFGIK